MARTILITHDFNVWDGFSSGYNYNYAKSVQRSPNYSAMLMGVANLYNQVKARQTPLTMLSGLIIVG